MSSPTNLVKEPLQKIQEKGNMIVIQKHNNTQSSKQIGLTSTGKNIQSTTSLKTSMLR